MVAPVAFVVIIVKFGNYRSKTTNSGKTFQNLNKYYINLLTFILFYRVTTKCLCDGSTLFGRNLISNYTTSSYAFDEESSAYGSTLTSRINLYTMAGATVTSDISDSMHIVRSNLGDTFFDDNDQTWTSTCSVDKCISKSSGTATIALESNIIGEGKKLLLNRYNNNLCYCRCLQNMPAFREDMHVCVNDLHECSLVTFVSGNNKQKIPYVFLPLRGQIVFPDAEIYFNGITSHYFSTVPYFGVTSVTWGNFGQILIVTKLLIKSDNEHLRYTRIDHKYPQVNTICPLSRPLWAISFRTEVTSYVQSFKRSPMCIISRVRYLSRSGWHDLRNYSYASTDQMNINPFKLFHDESRTFLQWLGNAELRSSLEGRLILIDLICKDRDTQLIFTPCISFRIAGVPSSKNMLSDEDYERNSNIGKNAKFSSNEYVALGIATLLLALIYVASVFLYLHMKKNKLKEKSSRRCNGLRKYINMEDTGSHLFSDNQSKKLIVEEEGLIKNNPLLMKRYYPTASNDSVSMSPSETSGRLNDENTFCSLISSKDKTSSQSGDSLAYDNSQTKTVSAIVHPRTSITSMNAGLKRFEKNEHPKWQVFGSNPLNSFKEHCVPKVENSIQQKMACERQQQADMNNIEEKHPDENISIVECPEDVVQTNSRHKLYFNPAYFEPELLMAPPPAAVEFLSKIREVMAVAKRKMSVKKFLPSLTEIPEEHQSIEGTKSNAGEMRNDSLNRKSDHEASPKPKYNSQQSENVELRVTDVKDKRQIIQKWLQSIPASSEDMCEHICKSRPCFNEIKERKNMLKGKTLDVPVHGENSLEKKPKLPSYNYPLNHKPPIDRPVVPAREKRLSSPKTKKTSTEFPPSNVEHDGTLEDEFNANLHLAANNSNLPLDEELTMHNAIYNIVTGSTTLSKLKSRYGTHEPQTTVNTAQPDAPQSAPGKYSLVSEVYVNDGYSSSEGDSSMNSLPERANDEPPKTSSLPKKDSESSRLMIQLNDCPFFYSVENADDFEPDTLDRKPTKDGEDTLSSSQMNFIDSLERPAISLRTYGSFRQDSLHNFLVNNNLKKFGSLQEIYESKRKPEEGKAPHCFMENENSFCSLTPQLECVLWRKDKRSPPLPPRQRYRQRKLSPPPPLPKMGDSLPHITSKTPKPPLPPRRGELFNTSNFIKKNMPSQCKNQNCAVLESNAFRCSNSASDNKLNVCFNNNIWTYRPEDSGYLSSSESEKSKMFSGQDARLNQRNNGKNSNNRANDDDEDDDDEEDSISSCDGGNSESGAESIETNFKFYKNRGKLTRENEINDAVERRSPIMNQH